MSDNVIVINGDLLHDYEATVYIGRIILTPDTRNTYIAVNDGIILTNVNSLGEDGIYRTNYILDVDDADDAAHIEEEWEIKVHEGLRELLRSLPEGIHIETATELDSVLEELNN